MTHDTRPSDPAMAAVSKFKVLIHSWLIPGLLGPASPQLSGLYTGPYFSLYTAGNVSVREGDIAHLPCRVHQVSGVTTGITERLLFCFYSPGQESHGLLDQEQGLGHPFHWQRHHHPWQEDLRDPDQSSGRLRPSHQVTWLFSETVNKQRQKINSYSD